MLYKIQTYNNITYEITEEQYLKLKPQLNTAKFVNIENTSVAVAAIKEIYPDYEAKNEREDEKVSAVAQLFGGNVAGYLSGRVSSIPRREIRLKLKKIWFEHIKRRPEVDKRMAPLWKAAKDRRERIALKEMPIFTNIQEQKIFSTPIEKLMEDYEKTLTN